MTHHNSSSYDSWWLSITWHHYDWVIIQVFKDTWYGEETSFNCMTSNEYKRGGRRGGRRGEEGRVGLQKIQHAQKTFKSLFFICYYPQGSHDLCGYDSLWYFILSVSLLTHCCAVDSSYNFYECFLFFLPLPFPHNTLSALFSSISIPWF